MNNGIPHDFSRQDYLCDVSRCTFYFDTGSNRTLLKGNHKGQPFSAFCIEESEGAVEVYITIPDGFECTHYKNGIITSSVVSDCSHLTYHGRPKRKKVTGEIHIKSSGGNPLNGKSPYTEAPTASSSNIQVHPLPLCRIELSDAPGIIIDKPDIVNFFETKTADSYFNTLEIHLARKGYMHNLVSVNNSVPPVWASLFIHMSMHAFYLDKIERRPGLFPQALVVQTQNFELIVLATHEYKNPHYMKNALYYFYTKDYFRALGSRNVLYHEGGWFIDQKSGLSAKSGAMRLSDFLIVDPD